MVLSGRSCQEACDLTAFLKKHSHHLFIEIVCDREYIDSVDD